MIVKPRILRRHQMCWIAVVPTSHRFTQVLQHSTAATPRSGRAGSSRGFVGHQFVAEHAGFLARRFGRKAPQQDQQRLGGLAGRFRNASARVRPCAAAVWPRRSTCRQIRFHGGLRAPHGTPRRSIPAIRRGSAARAGWRRRGRATGPRRGRAAEPDNSASAASNSSRLPDNSARRISPAVSWPVARRCRTRPRMSSPPRTRCDIDRRALARLVRDPLRAIGAEPVPRGDELRQRVG